ncbi:uncharacterized protein LOC132742776 [Ruditapes philippinarum]|uniref:uncharacterized protein LOC132742776 n=1 Tax=Ruditapes philippinarum TaxID=129788 RepID=UPI00295B626A|nr:uncharacterized protein LOC132742776 [Ruditapes philippinarum]
MNCTNHENTLCTLFCPHHDSFFCTACRDSKHGSCPDIKQVNSEKFYEKRKLDIKDKPESYNMKIRNIFGKNDNDQNDCYIIGISMLPNSEILLADNRNKKLKKLNKKFKIVSCCKLPNRPFSVCYIGNNLSIIALHGNVIQYVKVSGEIELRNEVPLSHECFGLACHGDTLYVASKSTIYTYDKRCDKKRILYQHGGRDQFYKYPIAISDNGERLYICTDKALTTIDSNGNHISTYQLDGLYDPDVCVANNGIVLLLGGRDNDKVYQLDYNGKNESETVRNFSDYSRSLMSLAFDRERCRLIFGDYTNYLHVYKCELLPC